MPNDQSTLDPIEFDPIQTDPYPPMPDLQAGPEPTRAMPSAPQNAPVNLEVPFIHQLWDTPDEFNGHWACGPTSTSMVLAYLKLLSPRPLKTQRNPAPNDFGWYVSSAFSLGSMNFNATAPTLDGQGAGIYGTALDDHRSPGSPDSFWCTGANASSVVRPPNARGLETIFRGVLPTDISFQIMSANGGFAPQDFANLVIPALEGGFPVIMGGRVNGYGHVIVVRGYCRAESGALSWIVNDPYGYRTTGRDYSGANVVYNFNEINPRWLVRFAQASRDLPRPVLITPTEPFEQTRDIQSDFDRALSFVLRWEGGYSNDPDDPGGATNQGIIQTTYNAYRQKKGLAPQSVQFISNAEVQEIYKTSYWNAVSGDQMGWSLNLVLFDTAVNMGPGRANGFLHQAKATFDTNYSTDELCRRVIDMRVNFYYGIVQQKPSQNKWLGGWLNRVRDLKAASGYIPNQSQA